MFPKLLINPYAKHMSKDTKANQNWFARHKILTIIGGIFVLFILLIAVSGGDSTDSTSTRSPANSSGEQEAVIYKINDEVVVGDVKWILDDAYTKTALSGAFGGTETTQGQYVVINATVENLGSDMKSISNLKITDDQGREFTSSSESFKNLGAEQLYILENLNPNLPYSFAEVYEVPADATGFSLKVGDLSLFGSKSASIDLGF